MTDYPITITSDEFAPVHTTLEALCAVDDGVRDNRAEIEAALAKGEAYVEGGGACPMFSIGLRADQRTEALREIDAAIAEVREAWPEMAAMEPGESYAASILARLTRAHDLLAERPA